RTVGSATRRGCESCIEPWSSALSVRRTTMSETSDIAALFAEGLALHQAGRLEEAEKVYYQTLAMNSDHFGSLHLLGVIFHQRGNHAEALSQIDYVLKKNPNNVFALSNRGSVLHELKRFEEALASYDRALRLRPDLASVHFNMAICRLLIGDFDRGWEKFEWSAKPPQDL